MQYSMSFSRWKCWMECPRGAHAKYVTREWQPGASEPMAIGALADAIVTQPDTEAEVLEKFAEFLTTKKGEPNASQKKAREMAAAALATPEITDLMDGAGMQAELFPQIGGVTWKCVLDMVRPDIGVFVDLKTTCRAGEVWVPHLRQYGSIIAAYRYGYQLAVYREAVRQAHKRSDWIACIALVEYRTLSDGTPCPQVRLHPWDDTDQLDDYLAQMSASLSYDHAGFDGSIDPPIMEMASQTSGEDLRGCGDCDWCLMHPARIEIPYSDPLPKWRRAG